VGWGGGVGGLWLGGVGGGVCWGGGVFVVLVFLGVLSSPILEGVGRNRLSPSPISKGDGDRGRPTLLKVSFPDKRSKWDELLDRGTDHRTLKGGRTPRPR